MDKPSQGAVSTVTAFAASHAAAEEFARSSRAMNELLRIDKLEEAQRRMAELARDKVTRAVVQTRKHDEPWNSDMDLNNFETEKDGNVDASELAAEVCLRAHLHMSHEMPNIRL